MLPRSSGSLFCFPGRYRGVPQRRNLTLTMLIRWENRCPQHQQARGRGAHREPRQGLIDTRLTQRVVSIKKALSNSLHCNRLERASVSERRGQDSLKACPLLFTKCSKRLFSNNFGNLYTTLHITQIPSKGNDLRYKNATNFCEAFIWLFSSPLSIRDSSRFAGALL